METDVELCHIRQQLQQAYQELEQDLTLSRRIQQKVLPRTLPDTSPARLAVRYRLCGRVGGDLYDVFQRDEEQVGFYLADVVGHGVSASLLTLFLQHAVRFGEASGRPYRCLPPHEVLQHLNRDLLELAAADNPFITMVYALFDRRTASLSFARAGSPLPIYVPRGGEPQRCHLGGTLLGLFETEFTTRTLRLRPGDKVLFHTDGVDAPSSERTLPERDDLLALVARSRALPVQELVEHLLQALLEKMSQSDDLTLVGLEMDI